MKFGALSEGLKPRYNPGVYIADEDIEVFKKVHCHLLDERRKIKKKGNCVAELLIRRGAVVVVTNNHQLRTSGAEVLHLEPTTLVDQYGITKRELDGEEKERYTAKEGWSNYHTNLPYEEGKVVIPDKLDTNIKNECSNGIYFLPDRGSAERMWRGQ